MKRITSFLLGLAVTAVSASGAALTADITIHGDKPGAAISPTLYGVFFEDINYAADGGLYAEMVQNRSFEYFEIDPAKLRGDGKKTPTPPLLAWLPVERGMTSTAATNSTSPLNPRNSTYVTPGHKTGETMEAKFHVTAKVGPGHRTGRSDQP